MLFTYMPILPRPPPYLTWDAHPARFAPTIRNEGRNEMTTYRLPRGFREDPDTLELRCPHRDVSCCDACATKYADRIVDFHGSRAWASTDAEREQLLSLYATLG